MWSRSSTKEADLIVGSQIFQVKAWDSAKYSRSGALSTQLDTYKRLVDAELEPNKRLQAARSRVLWPSRGGKSSSFIRSIAAFLDGRRAQQYVDDIFDSMRRKGKPDLPPGTTLTLSSFEINRERELESLNKLLTAYVADLYTQRSVPRELVRLVTASAGSERREIKIRRVARLLSWAIRLLVGKGCEPESQGVATREREFFLNHGAHPPKTSGQRVASRFSGWVFTPLNAAT